MHVTSPLRILFTMHEREIPNKRIAKGNRKKEEGFIFNSIIERKTSLMCETFARHGQAMEARTSIGTRHVDSLFVHVMQTPIKVPHHIVVPSSLSDANCDVDIFVSKGPCALPCAVFRLSLFSLILIAMQPRIPDVHRPLCVRLN